MSIGMTPFRALYGYDAPTLVEFVFGENKAPKAKDWIIESQVLALCNLPKATEAITEVTSNRFESWI
jgi:hypothetical protein